MLRVLLVLDDYNELVYLQTILKKLGVDSDGLQNTRKFDDVRLGFNPQVIVVSAFGKKVNGIGLSSQIRKINGMPKVVALQSPSQNFVLEEVADAGIDVLLDTPVNIRSFLESVAECGGVSFKALLEKYSKLKLSGQIKTREGERMLGSDTSDGVGEQGAETDYYDQEFQEYGAKVASSEKPQIESQGKAAVVVSEESSESEASLVGVNLKQKLASSIDTESRKKRYESFINKMEKPAASGGLDSKTIADFNKKMRAKRDQELDKKVDEDRKGFVKALFQFAKNLQS